MALFDNGDPEEFLFLKKNYKMALNALVTLTIDAKFQYLRTLLHGKALHDFEILCIQIWSITTAHLNLILLSLGMWFNLPTHCLKKMYDMPQDEESEQIESMVLRSAYDLT